MSVASVTNMRYVPQYYSPPQIGPKKSEVLSVLISSTQYLSTTYSPPQIGPKISRLGACVCHAEFIKMLRQAS